MLWFTSARWASTAINHVGRFAMSSGKRASFYVAVIIYFLAVPWTFPVFIFVAPEGWLGWVGMAAN